MEFKNEDCTFTVPDRPTVRQQLQWYGAAGGRDPENLFIRYWEGAKQLVEKWDCPALPDYKAVDLDAISDPTQASIILWAGTKVAAYLSALEDIPKNA